MEEWLAGAPEGWTAVWEGAGLNHPHVTEVTTRGVDQ